MATMSVISNDGALESASAVLEVTATNPEAQPTEIHFSARESIMRRPSSLHRMMTT